MTDLQETLRCPCCHGPVSPLDLLLDEFRGYVVYNGATAVLTGKMFKLFRGFADAFPRGLTKEQIYHLLYDEYRVDDYPEAKIVDVMVCKLRPLLAPLHLAITTQWGVGYTLETAEPQLVAELQEKRFRESRNKRSRVEQGDLAVVKLLRQQGYPLTDVARRAGLTYKAVSTAIAMIEDVERRGARA